MSKFQKAVERLLSKAKDFKWQELQTILGRLGYRELVGQGSRRKFIHEKTKHIIILHEPHPQPILKAYAINYVIDELKKQNLI